MYVQNILQPLFDVVGRRLCLQYLGRHLERDVVRGGAAMDLRLIAGRGFNSKPVRFHVV